MAEFLTFWEGESCLEIMAVSQVHLALSKGSPSLLVSSTAFLEVFAEKYKSYSTLGEVKLGWEGVFRTSYMRSKQNVRHSNSHFVPLNQGPLPFVLLDRIYPSRPNASQFVHTGGPEHRCLTKVNGATLVLHIR